MALLDAWRRNRELCCLLGHTRDVVHAAFSPDGRRVVTASDDRTARVCDLSGEVPRSIALEGHTHWVEHAAFSPNGQWLVTASRDKTARVWETPLLPRLSNLARAARTRGLTRAQRERYGLPIPPHLPAGPDTVPPPDSDDPPGEAQDVSI